MKQTLSISLLVIALLFIGASCSMIHEAQEPTENESADEVAQQEVGAQENVVDDQGGQNQEIYAQGDYREYDTESVRLAARSGKSVIFFYAPWCSTCGPLHDDIEKNIEHIPGDVTIFRANFDSETQLKKQYGVTLQHTLVQVDTDGNTVQKWIGGDTLQSILDRVN